MKRIAIIGYSGHSYVVIDACKSSGILVEYYCEKQEALKNPFNLTYIGDETSDDFDWDFIDAVVIGVGDNNIRSKIAKQIIANKKPILNTIHTSSVINEFVTLGFGNLIASNVIINPLAKIGDNNILNSGCIIEHECNLGNNLHIGPGAVLAGNVTVGDYAFIGANSVVKQGLRIGEGAIIGAGSVVLKDVPHNEIWVGNPAKLINR